MQTDVCLRIRLQGRRRSNRQHLLIIFLQRMQRHQLFELWSLMNRPVRIGTRGSKLALWQANWVKTALEKRNPKLSVELVVIKTKGDKILDVPLANVGGKGLFVKEIEEALLGNQIDVAVHSMKDMPAELPAGLVIGAVPERENPRDVLIAKTGDSLETLPRGARVGTSSLRRKAQLKHLRPDVRIEPLRGNLDTRLRKLAETDLEAIILAAAGVQRLGLSEKITAYIPMAHMLPAVGQGALCIELRDGDPRITPLIAALDHRDTHTAVMAERAFLHRLEGSCQVPIAALGTLNSNMLSLTGRVSDPEGSQMIAADIQGDRTDAASLGRRLADDLLSRGADKILERLKHNV